MESGIAANLKNNCCANVSRWAAIPGTLGAHVIRVPRETIPDASTTTLIRKSPADGMAIRRIKEDRDVIAGWRPLRFSFPYRQVFPEV